MRTYISDNRYRHLPGLRLQCGDLSLVVYHPDEQELVRWAIRGWNSVPAQAELAEARKTPGGEIYLLPKKPSSAGQVEKLVPTRRDRWVGRFVSGLAQVMGA